MPEKDMTVLASLIDKVSELDERDKETWTLAANAYLAGKLAGKQEATAAQ
ncbi:MAG: hypothetical protein IJX67_10315 [Oscillospiraceae bacterium]|nr:hypothetical protein [Oscillospiraceae bacterium]